MRKDGRRYNQLRFVEIHPDFIKNADGSVLIKIGQTRVICTASVENAVPPFLKGSGKGWVTSEYSMIPRSTPTRTPRESTRGKPSGRTHEIQRLIGRCLRSVVQLEELGERTVWIDCDVIEADGGTRTASITGGFVALALALKRLALDREGRRLPLRDFMAATSVGLVNGELLLDLDYEEDSGAQVDMNVVQTGSGRFVELQGTAEGEPFSREVSNQLIDLASLGIQQLIEVQRRVLHWRPETIAIA
jgi:ribonuclease PH